MSLILLVEQEDRLAEQVRAALTAEGWQVSVVADPAAARRVAGADGPDLVLVGGVEGAAELAEELASARGGPGCLAVVPAGEAHPTSADGVVEVPFTDQQLRSAVRQCLARLKRAAAQSAAQEAASVGAQLTSRELFGDVLAEVEREVAAQAPPSRPPSPQARGGMEEVERQLEETLSGVLRSSRSVERSVEPRPVRARATDESGVDELLSQTLSGMGVMRRPRSASPAGTTKPRAARVAPQAPDAGARPAPADADSAAPASDPAAAGASDAAPAPSISQAPVEASADTPPQRRPAASPVGAGIAAPPAVPGSAPPGVIPAPDLPSPEPAAGELATQAFEVGSATAGSQPRQFGQYTLLERVAVGGMAEVWKARMRGVEGFQKTVAIKKILPQLTDSVDFVTMFIDEAKLAAQLNHPHIIHIYDLGKLEDDYYIAMEFVEGRDLRSILTTARERGESLPLGLALLVAARLASALDHAHRKRDFDDRELGLVHRDVSPQNVLISYEGDIKLCDFGIAKAVAKASKTQMGALKGKLQYMSPEQAWGRVVDARSDIFSLGAVLFEMLTSRRLFAGDTEISVLEAVREGNIQSPREVNPGVPAEVEAVVLEALARDPDDRFQTAGELQQALEAILYAVKPTPGQGDLARFMAELYAAERAGATVSDGPSGEAAALTATGGSAAEAPAVAPAPGFPAAEPERRSPVALWAAVIAVVLLGGAALGYRLLGGGPGPVPPEPAVATAAMVEPMVVDEEGRSDQADVETVPGEEGEPENAIDVEGMVDAQLKAREDELRRQFEEERRRLERELQQVQVEAVAAPASTAPAEPAPLPREASLPAPVEAGPPDAEPSTAPAAGRELTAAAAPTPSEAEAAAASEPAVEASPGEQPAAQATAPAIPAPVLDPTPAPAGAREGDLVPLGASGLIPPVLVGIEKPEYPALAKRLRVQGTVVVGVLVDESGRVAEARLTQGVPQNVGINEAAMQAARTARFSPATKDGVRVKVWFSLTIPFRL